MASIIPSTSSSSSSSGVRRGVSGASRRCSRVGRALVQRTAAPARRREVRDWITRREVAVTAAIAVVDGGEEVQRNSSDAEASTSDDGDDARGGGLPVRVIVEAAMLAAMTGLSFHLSSLFRFDAYFGALFPLPVVIAAARWGTAAAARTMFTATLLLLLISGPLRAVNYLCLHGALAFTLGSLWLSGKGWAMTVPVSALTRTAGIMCSLAVSSLLYRENVMKLLVTQMYSLLDQFCANIGATFAPTMGWVWATALFFILINSFSYTLILHMVYTIVLNAVTGRNFVNAPAKVCRALGVSSSNTP